MQTKSAAAKPSSTSATSPDAIALLTADHAKVKAMFKRFEKLHEAESDDDAEELAQEICNEVTIHATVEEEIFYPALRDAIDDDDLMNEAEVEHDSAKDLIGDIEAMDGSDEKFAATVMVLGEYINHHVEEEEGEMFPKAKKAKLDLEELGETMETRKQELKDDLGVEDDEEEDDDDEQSPADSATKKS